MDSKALALTASAAIVVAGGSVAGIQIGSLTARLDEARADADVAEQNNESAEDRLSELESELAAAERRLSRLRRMQREVAQAQTLGEALASGTATRVAGLSADISDFDCIRTCATIEGTATFVNRTPSGSAVTCVFKVEFEDGETSHFTWFTEYVPPKDRAIADLYFASNYGSPVDYWYDSEECYRGVATFNAGPGDI